MDQIHSAGQLNIIDRRDTTIPSLLRGDRLIMIGEGFEQGTMFMWAPTVATVTEAHVVLRFEAAQKASGLSPSPESFAQAAP